MIINNESLVSNYSFDHLSAKFISKTIPSLNNKLVSIVFTSPLSARSPDTCMLWHDGYRQKNKIRLLKISFISVFLALKEGLLKILFDIKPYNYGIEGSIKNSLLVVPSQCIHKSSSGQYKTVYVDTAEDDAIFMFGRKGTCGSNEKTVKTLSLRDKIITIFLLLRGGTSAYFKTKGNSIDLTLLFLNWLSWVLNLWWLEVYYLEGILSDIVNIHKLKKIGCIHEMHAYARIIWQVAAKYNIESYTVQHAAISSGKKWYLCYPEEVYAGLKFPSVMYVYNKRIASILKPFLTTTIFKIGCSSRYAYWKNVHKSRKKGKYYLFVGALASFDNDVLFSALRKIISISQEFAPIRLRPHPSAIINGRDRNWLNSCLSKGIFELSKNIPLKDDLNNAIAVVGMSTTVLEEALLFCRPVIQLVLPQYVRYIDIDGIRGTKIVDCRQFSWKDLLEISNMEVDSEAAKEKFGLNEEEVTYSKLFS